MNIQKSLKTALAKRGMKAQDLADKMGVSRIRVYAITRQKSVTNAVIENLCNALDMKVSEFIALGED